MTASHEWLLICHGGANGYVLVAGDEASITVLGRSVLVSIGSHRFVCSTAEDGGMLVAKVGEAGF